MNKLKVLIVNDTLRETCKPVFIQMGFEVYSPGDPQVALGWGQPGPDVIIAQIYKQGALSFTKELRKVGYKGLIFVIMDHTTIDAQFIDDCRMCGLSGIFDKATSPEILAAGITQAVKACSNPLTLAVSLN